MGPKALFELLRSLYQGLGSVVDSSSAGWPLALSWVAEHLRCPGRSHSKDVREGNKQLSTNTTLGVPCCLFFIVSYTRKPYCNCQGPIGVLGDGESVSGAGLRSLELWELQVQDLQSQAQGFGLRVLGLSGFGVVWV